MGGSEDIMVEKSFFFFFFPCEYFMLKGTSGPKEDVRGLKNDCECLRWIGGHILKVLTLSLHHVCPPFPGLCYFQGEGNELESGKGFFFCRLTMRNDKRLL